MEVTENRTSKLSNFQWICREQSPRHGGSCRYDGIGVALASVGASASDSNHDDRALSMSMNICRRLTLGRYAANNKALGNPRAAKEDPVTQ